MVQKSTEPCFSCKMISVCCMLGIGGYLFYQGRKQTRFAKYTFYSIASGASALGVGEIFDYSPFRYTQ